MAVQESQIVIAVFDSQDRAERTVVGLRDDGLGDDQIALVAPGDYPLGVAAALEACGVAEEAAAYYAAEVDSGRRLVVVRVQPDEARPVLAAFGRNGGQVPVPPEGRNGS
jgi:hypothetical protein